MSADPAIDRLLGWLEDPAYGRPVPEASALRALIEEYQRIAATLERVIRQRDRAIETLERAVVLLEARERRQ